MMQAHVEHKANEIKVRAANMVCMQMRLLLCTSENVLRMYVCIPESSVTL